MQEETEKANYESGMLSTPVATAQADGVEAGGAANVIPGITGAFAAVPAGSPDIIQQQKKELARSSILQLPGDLARDSSRDKLDPGGIIQERIEARSPWQEVSLPGVTLSGQLGECDDPSVWWLTELEGSLRITRESTPEDMSLSSEAPSLDGVTTLMLQNVPNHCTRSMLEGILDREGFRGQYDFLYLPCEFGTKSCFGYAFLNMVSSDAVHALSRHFDGFTEWPVRSDKTVALVNASAMMQGFNKLVERYRNSPLMHFTVDDNLRPAVYHGGVRVPFPAPTSQLRPPRLRPRKQRGKLMRRCSTHSFS